MAFGAGPQACVHALRWPNPNLILIPAPSPNPNPNPNPNLHALGRLGEVGQSPAGVNQHLVRVRVRVGARVRVGVRVRVRVGVSSSSGFLLGAVAEAPPHSMQL